MVENKSGTGVNSMGAPMNEVAKPKNESKGLMVIPNAEVPSITEAALNGGRHTKKRKTKLRKLRKSRKSE